VHLINFTANRQFVAPKTPPSASRKPLATIVSKIPVKNDTKRNY